MVSPTFKSLAGAETERPLNYKLPERYSSSQAFKLQFNGRYSSICPSNSNSKTANSSIWILIRNSTGGYSSHPLSTTNTSGTESSIRPSNWNSTGNARRTSQRLLRPSTGRAIPLRANR